MGGDYLSNDKYLNANGLTYLLQNLNTIFATKEYVSNNMPNNIAPVYDSTSTYEVGDYCIYNNYLYKCKSKISLAENWTSAHWDAVMLLDELQNIENLSVRCEKIVLSIDTVNIYVGDTYQIPAATLSPSNTTESIRYLSQDTTVCNVSGGGLITGIGLGTAIVEVICGECKWAIRVNVSAYLPKDIGFLGFLSGLSDNNTTFNIWVGSSNRKNYVIPFLTQKIKPGQILHIRKNNDYYAMARAYIIKDNYSLSINSSGSYSFSNVELVQSLGSSYSNYSLDYTNETSSNLCLIISFAFYESQDSDITEEQIASFISRDSAQLWVSLSDAAQPSVDNSSKVNTITTGMIDDIISTVEGSI